jgi:hypothetical protein
MFLYFSLLLVKFEGMIYIYIYIVTSLIIDYFVGGRHGIVVAFFFFLNTTVEQEEVKKL